MDFLTDPNIAYLFLLGGVFLSMLALAAPGTGLLELGALFCIVLAVYPIVTAQLSINWWALVVMLFGIVPFIYSIRKPKRELYLAISILLLVVGSVFLYPNANGGPAVNPVVALAASTLAAGFLWIAISKSLQAAHMLPTHSLDALIGQIGEAKTKVFRDGSVQVDGELWSARSEKSISSGSKIRVLRREGFVLIVEESR